MLLRRNQVWMQALTVDMYTVESKRKKNDSHLGGLREDAREY